MDKAQRKQQLAQWRDQQRKAALAALPLPPAELRSLFDSLDSGLPSAGCDHTLRLTMQWLSSHGHDSERVVAWLKSQGGYCDCEVLANVEQKLDEAIKGENAQ
jgi:Protein of unknown function (DUF2695)